MVQEFPEAEKNVDGAMFAALQALEDLLVDALWRIVRSDGGFHAAHMVFRIVRVVDIAAHVDRNHPRDFEMRPPDVRAYGLVQVIKQKAVHRHLVIAAMFEDVFCFLLGEQMPRR